MPAPRRRLVSYPLLAGSPHGPSRHYLRTRPDRVHHFWGALRSLRRPPLSHRSPEHGLGSETSHLAQRADPRQLLEDVLHGLACRFVVVAGVVPGTGLRGWSGPRLDALRRAAPRLLDLLPR